MLDTEIKRKVLQELMDQMDGVTRDDMRGSLMDHDEPQTELDKHTPTDMPEIMGDKEPDEDDDIKSIDPIVMLAKRFHK